MADDRPLVFQASIADANLLPYGLQEVEQVRLLLRGGSVIDWRRLGMRDLGHVDQLLRRLGFEPDDPDDEDRLWSIHGRAVDYLDRNFDLKLAEGVRDPDDVRHLFLLASQAGPAQRDACIVLKVMHVIHHVAGRELLSRLPVAAVEIFHRIETAVFDAVDGMKARGVQVAEFTASRKTADSILTKLLSRRDSLAAEVHDKLRFRVVTEDLGGLFGALVYMTTELFPFNYVIPGESRNDLIDFHATLGNDPHLRKLLPALQLPADAEEIGGPSRENVFSGKGFKMINFVVDFPVRVDDLVARMPDYRADDGVVVFELVEFQLVDQATDADNNSGENRHSLYKARQHRRVLERLNANHVGEE
jgi:uncharacterized protein (TIGR04552 family)